MLNVYLYTYAGDKNVLRKQSHMTALSALPVSCDVYSPCAVENPTILLSYDAAILRQCNYVYIPDFGRYYFVAGRSVNSAGQMTFELKSDVLMTVGEALLNAQVTISRGCPLDYKPTYIRDMMFPLQQQKQIQTFRLDKQPFIPATATSGSKLFVLNVAGKEAGNNES